MASVLVVTPGLHTTIQDRGRWGLQGRGVPVAGPMDAVSHRIANALVGNAPDAATLEVTISGPELRFEDERLVSIAGPPFAIAVGDRRVPMNARLEVPAGASLRIGTRERGARAYVAIEGGLSTPLVMGSRATHVSSGLGGLHGRAVAAGDRLPLGQRNSRPRSGGPHVHTPLRQFTTPARVRVIPGPQHDRFVDGALETLQSGAYTISTDSNRMGYRLVGPAIHHARRADMISDATALGSLQVPPSGQPLLLMADRQTTGGYPIIATAITADIPVAAQLAPGDAITFAVCSRGEALAALIAQERALMTLENGASR